MDLDGVSDLGNSVNYEDVGALSQRRIIAFFNEFVGQTVRFLNKFSSECEEKLFIVDTRLEKLETMLSILEAKLSSVPGLTAVTTNGDSAHNAEEAPRPDGASGALPGDSQSASTEHTNGRSAPSPPSSDQPASGVAESGDSGLVPLRQTEPYRRYFRMLEVGVPEPAVRIKMQQEGVDPDALQRGDQLVPERTAAGARRDSRSEESDVPSWESESS